MSLSTLLLGHMRDRLIGIERRGLWIRVAGREGGVIEGQMLKRPRGNEAWISKTIE